jgi:hypothetical protein
MLHFSIRTVLYLSYHINGAVSRRGGSDSTCRRDDQRSRWRMKSNALALARADDGSYLRGLQRNGRNCYRGFIFVCIDMPRPWTTLPLVNLGRAHVALAIRGSRGWPCARTRPGARASTRSQSNSSGCESLALSPSYLNIGSRLADAGRPLMGTERSAPRRPTFDGRSRWHPEQTSVAPATFLPRRLQLRGTRLRNSLASVPSPDPKRTAPSNRRDRKTGNNKNVGTAACVRASSRMTRTAACN